MGHLKKSLLNFLQSQNYFLLFFAVQNCLHGFTLGSLKVFLKGKMSLLSHMRKKADFFFRLSKRGLAFSYEKVG